MFKTALRLILTPLMVFLLVGTAVLEYASSKPDWKFYKDFNAGVIDLIIWVPKCLK